MSLQDVLMEEPSPLRARQRRTSKTIFEAFGGAWQVRVRVWVFKVRVSADPNPNPIPNPGGT